MKTDSQPTEKSSLVVKREGNSPVNSSNSLTKKNQGVTQQKTTSQKSDEKIDPNQHIYEAVWRIIFLIMLFIGLVLIEKVYRFHNDPVTVNIPKGSIYDFYISVLTACIIAIIRFFIKQLFQKKIYDLLGERRKKTYEEGMKRADQLCKWSFDIIYYSFSTVIGYLIVKNQAFLPPTMLGHGQCSNLFMQYPEVPQIPYLRLFYLVQAGTHLYTLVYQLVAKRQDPKFYEYSLHHLLAIFLIWFSYMMNFLIVGTIVLILHDPCDVFLVSARAYNDLKCRVMAFNAVLVCISYPLWLYTRNFIFPQCVIKSCYDFFINFDFEKLPRDIFFLPCLYMIVMLGVLAAMHIYWAYFYSKAVITFIQGKDKNGYDS
ncbi:hypothetical protein ABPG72_008376 [Tetrahymena utriculariae]